MPRKLTSKSLGAGSVTSSQLDSSVNDTINNVTINTAFSGTHIKVPVGTTAERPELAVIGMLRYNTTLGFLEQYTADGWQGIAPPPIITTVSPTSYNGEQGTSFTINGSNFDVNATAKFITSQGTEFNASTVSRVNSTQLLITTPQDFTVAQEPLSVKVINGSGLSVVKESIIDCGGVPIWNTSAGTLGSYYDGSSISISVTASDSDNDSNITYSIISGGVPSGLSFNTSNGLISGIASIVASTTTSNFTIRATDNAGNTNERAFSMTIIATNYFGSGSDGVGSY